MPGEGFTHGPPATRKLAAVTTGPAGTTDIPCAMVLTAYPRALPGVPGLLAPVACKIASRLDASVGAPGPHVYILAFGETRRN